MGAAAAVLVSGQWVMLLAMANVMAMVYFTCKIVSIVSFASQSCLSTDII